MKGLYIKLTEEQHQNFKEYAVKNKTNMSELVKMAIEQYIAQGKRGEDSGRE